MKRREDRRMRNRRIMMGVFGFIMAAALIASLVAQALAAPVPPPL